MTRHLRDTEFVDFAEGTLAAPRAAHVDACGACRAQAEAIAGVLREASAVEMPEPSPLFWDHFSARVREQVAHGSPDRASWWELANVRARLPLVAVLAVAIAIFSAAMLPRLMRTSPGGMDLPGRTAVDARPAAPLPDADGAVDDQNAEVWAVLTAAASDMGLEDAHAAGMGARPGAVDHAVTHLNQAELTELGRLLQTELKGSGH